MGKSEFFWASSNMGGSEKWSYLEFQMPNRGVLYTVGRLMKFSTTFIWIILADSVIRLVQI